MATIVITGGNRGIGLEMIRGFSERGDRVIVACRRTSDALAALDVEVHENVDVSDPASVREFAERLDEEAVDVLVNNAGQLSIQSLGDIDEPAVEAMEAQFRTNSIAPVLMSQAIAPRMGRGGRIAIITSRMGSIADNTSGGSYGYRMSKAAVNIAGVSLARDLEEKGIAVGLLHPGFVKTDMTRHQGNVKPAESAADLIRRIDELSMENTGSFRHANGENLPW